MMKEMPTDQQQLSSSSEDSNESISMLDESSERLPTQPPLEDDESSLPVAQEKKQLSKRSKRCLPKNIRKLRYLFVSILIASLCIVILILWLKLRREKSTTCGDVSSRTTEEWSTEQTAELSDEVSTQPRNITSLLLSTTASVTDVTESESSKDVSPHKQRKKVLFVIADGIPADIIENITLNHMERLRNIGAYTRAFVGGEKGTYSQTATISSPGYMSLITGTWGNKHNVYDNYVKKPNYHYKNIFRLVKEADTEKRIAIFSTWTTNRVKLVGEGLAEAGNITFDYKFDGYELDRDTYPHDKRSVYIRNIDQRVTNETSACIKTDAPDLSWVYLQYTDDIGHFYGDSAEFRQSILYLDDQIGQIWEAVDYRIRDHQEDWLMIVTTDHGRDPKTGKHHAGQSVRERTTWIITNSEQTNSYFHEFEPGIVDIMPTILRFMNLRVPIESEREFDGIPFIGNVSLIRPTMMLSGDQLNISWTILDPTGSIKVWLSTTNHFRKGFMDNYTFIDEVPVDRRMLSVDVKDYPSQFYKVVLDGPFNMVNRWITRPKPFVKKV